MRAPRVDESGLGHDFDSIELVVADFALSSLSRGALHAATCRTISRAWQRQFMEKVCRPHSCHGTAGNEIAHRFHSTRGRGQVPHGCRQGLALIFFACAAALGSVTGVGGFILCALQLHSKSMWVCRCMSGLLVGAAACEADLQFVWFFFVCACCVGVFACEGHSRCSTSVADERPSPLKNQNMSCYLNALCQALWACSGFRSQCQNEWNVLHPQEQAAWLTLEEDFK
eukprot:10296476-Karenia_brevis.AAC.1